MAEPIGNNSHLIDTGLYGPLHGACYLVQDAGEFAIIDTGTHQTVPRILADIAALGASPDQVRYVMPTHVHLDHAGGAGQLMESCPNATLVVHPRGLPHMTDPSKLQAGAIGVYGEEAFLRDFGELIAVPEERTVSASDQQVFELGGRRLQFIDTPGHANHHGCFFDQHSGYLYTGDTFGLGYSQFRQGKEPLLVATTTPVAFDPDAWYDSLDRMMALTPQACCLTHYGKIERPEQRVDMLRSSIRAHVDIALEEEKRDSEGREARLKKAVDRLLVDAGCAHSNLPPDQVRHIFESDIDLNSQGLNIWLIRRAKKRA